MTTDSKNPKKTTPLCATEEVRVGRRVTWVGFWVNAVLAVLKIAGGIIGRSSALVADGVHSLSDFLSDILVIVMLGIARKKPDADHEFGHGRYEALATLILTVMLGIVGAGLFYDGAVHTYLIYRGTIPPAPMPLALIIIVISIVSKEWLYRYTRHVGERIRSDAVIANAWHHRSDAFSSLATLVGVGGAFFLGPQWRVLDPIAAMIVALFIIIVAVRMGQPALGEMLGRSLPEKDRAAITAAIRATPGVVRFHGLRTFKSGKDAYVEVHLMVDPEITVRAADNISIAVERAILAALPSYDATVTTHIEPA